MKALFAIALLPLVIGSCAPGEESESTPIAEGSDGSSEHAFEAFVTSLPREPETGAYIVEGDIPVWSREGLRSWFNESRGQGVAASPDSDLQTMAHPLAIHTINGNHSRWGVNLQTNLEYCVSTSFGSNYAAVVNAMASAADAWELGANVAFIHDSNQDANCTASNNNVVFDVRPVSGVTYDARAFFPTDARGNRNILIRTGVITSLPTGKTLAGILQHELGHGLGFRHEHTAGALSCYESADWAPLTTYDSMSVMHYSQCGGSTGDYAVTAKDLNGAGCLYGGTAARAPDCSYRGVIYKAHVSVSGWLPTVLKGNIAGTVGQSRSSQAYVLQMLNTPGVGICYTAHVAGLGWLSEVCNGSTAGTTGQSRGLQAIRIRLTNAPAGCGISYQAHVGNIGWQAPVANNAVAGTTGQSRDIQALKVWTTDACGFTP